MQRGISNRLLSILVIPDSSSELVSNQNRKKAGHFGPALAIICLFLEGD